MDNNDRITELSAELIATHAATELVARAWGHASPDGRTALADAVLAKLARQIEKDDGWGSERKFREVTDRLVADAVRRAIEPRQAELVGAVHAHVAERWDAAVARAVDEILKQAREAAVRTVYQALEKIRG